MPFVEPKPDGVERINVDCAGQKRCEPNADPFDQSDALNLGIDYRIGNLTLVRP